jgi:hypothetical protein
MPEPADTGSSRVVSAGGRREGRASVQHRGGVPGLLLVAIVTLALAVQGWKSRIPSFDMLTTIDEAQLFIDTGRLPEKGVLTSFLSFTPPGATWLMAPGVWLFDDPRLFELGGSVSVYIGTLVGIFLLTRRYLGRDCALLAVILYGVSGLGMQAATSVWQRYPIHGFFVWTIYWAARWAEEDRPWFLAASLVTWTAGIYVFMEMAPAIFVIPVIWLVRRPSVRLLPLVLAGVAGAGIWYPHLRFESERGFADLMSQIRRERIAAAFADSWCDPALVPAQWRLDEAEAVAAGSPAAPARIRVRQWMSEKAGTIAGELLLTNFRDSRVPGAPLILFVLTVATSALLLVGANTRFLGGATVWVRWLKWLGIGAAVTALVVNEAAVARLVAPDGTLDGSSAAAIRIFQAALLAAALVLVVWRRPIASALESAMNAWRSSAAGVSPAAALGILGLVIPWALLFVVSEDERRLWWMWPMQVLPLAAAVTYVPSRLGMPRWVGRVGSLAVIGLVAANPVLLSRVEGWTRHGWAGNDAMEIEVVDRVADRMKTGGERQAVIGYDVDFWRFAAIFNVADARYKVGADFDLLLKYRHGIANLNRCPEGVSPQDEYRVVQTVARDDDPSNSNRNRIVSTVAGTFDVTDRVGAYEISRRR